jgi:hypothetical protein
MPGDFKLKGTVQYFEKIEWVVIYLPRMSSLQIKFFEYLFNKLLYEFTENTLSEISTKSVYISINNNMNFFIRIDSFYLHYMG